VKHQPLAAAARRRLIAPVGMGGFIASVVVVVGLLAAACSSSTSPAASTTHVADTTPAKTSNWSTVDLNTGSITPVHGSGATSGAFYVVSPDQTKVAYNPCCSWETPVRMANLNGTQVHHVSAAASDGVGEQWSPDGSLLLYQQRDGSTNQLGNLFVQNLATGQRTRVTNLDHKEWGWWFTYPSFSPDGKSILYQRPNGHLPNDDNRSWDLWSAPVTGGKPTLVQRNAAWGSYSPDGKRLAYLSPLKEGDFTGSGLWIKNVHGRTPRALIRGGGLRWVRWSPDGTRIAYSDGNAIYTVDAATGTTKKVVGHGGQPEWLNNHTLIFSS
jgi:Tol biopolymer transport system component